MDKEVEAIVHLIEEGKNYLLSGGAGSGKTYSLVQVIREVISMHPSCKIACMTYTNASVHEIERRVDHSNLNVSTIHDFLWDNIKNFQKELKATLIELMNTEDSGIKLNDYDGEIPSDFYETERESNFSIQYKEYLKLRDGIISHDEVIILSDKMFEKYPKIISFVKSRYPFIFIDEYQDTNPLIVKILLDYFKRDSKKCIVGFFGDSMQAIYDNGVGDINKYIVSEDNPGGCVYEVQKSQNRRCPQSVIDLANKLRLDNLHQVPSDDVEAPNMKEGHIKEGSVIFFYSDVDKTNQLKTELKTLYGWDFSDQKQTKELRLTHNLIADEAGFPTLMQIHDSDKIIEYANRLKKYASSKGVLDEINSMTLGEAIGYFASKNPSEDKKWSATDGQKEFIESNQELYTSALNIPLIYITRYVNKDQLLDDKSDEDTNKGTGSQLSHLNKHLDKIEHCIQLYQSKDYNEFMRVSSFKQVRNAREKMTLRKGIDKIASSCEDMTISGVIDLADELGICIKDDKLDSYIKDNPYLWMRIKDVKYVEARNVYNYRNGNKPFSTQHKTKGLEYNNVLVILKSNWSKYDFASLFYDTGKKGSVVNRTKKLFYVCCTRAKENLVVYYPGATANIIEGAIAMFGETNIKRI